MKRLLLLISFTIFFLYSFTQTDVQRDNRVNPILKQALASKNGYYIYGRTGTSGFINIAVLNQSSHTLCWFTCHGRLFDSTRLTVQEYGQVTKKQVDPFELYQHICEKYLADIAAAKDIYRLYGDVKLLDKLNGNYRAMFAMEIVQAAKTPLQKLIAIENVRKKILTQLAYLNCVSPFGLQDDPLYKISKEQAGAMIQSKDSTVYYNIDPTSAVAKISLYKKSAGQLYIQNRFSEIIDSVAIQPEKYDLLQKEKTDVFLLYRGWLEMQWQGAMSAIRRQGARLYNQVNAQDEKEVKELYNQVCAIGAKINQMSSPEAKSIEQAVYDTYKNETSEISYIPILGIAYSLVQTRGQKEYELTNHLGNVLAIVSDKKIGVPSSSNSSLIDHYEPDIVSAQDYYPFGMLQPGRSYLSPNGDKYRYGFNGKENDNEVKGEGNQQDYGMRVYDPRLGRFLSVDPLARDYPGWSPYPFAMNRPIDGVDLDGGEWKPITDWLADKAKASGHPTLSGFVRGFGGLDIQSQQQQLTNNAMKGNYRAVAKQLYGYSLKAMVDHLEETTKRAVDDNDQEAYGELYNFVFLGALGDAVMGEPPTFKFSEHPVAKTNKLAIEAHGNFEAGEGNAANTTTNRVNTTGKGTGSGSVDAVTSRRVTNSEVKDFISTEPGAQAPKSVANIQNKINNKDLSVWSEPIFTTTYKGKTYILDGHNRMVAVSQREKPLNVTVQELSTEEATKRYPDKMKDIKEGSFDKKISEDD